MSLIDPETLICSRHVRIERTTVHCHGVEASLDTSIVSQQDDDLLLGMLITFKLFLCNAQMQKAEFHLQHDILDGFADESPSPPE